MKLVFWGSFDSCKPRVRILQRGLKENGVEILTIHRDVWKGIEDKSQVKGVVTKVAILIKWLFSYPSLVFQYLRTGQHDAVVISYLGHLDLFFIFPFAKLRGKKIIWDAFLSLYNTVVEDRRLVGRYNPIAILLYLWEWLACRLSDLIILDTKAHGDYFVKKYNLNPLKVKSVFVGAEPEIFINFNARNRNDSEEKTNAISGPQPKGNFSGTSEGLSPGLKILFYGQFIPLHGIPTIIEAAKLAEKFHWEWTIIGKGQVEPIVRKKIDEYQLKNLEWIPWVAYEELQGYIHRSDICLGIFSNSEKASRVIPNKIFQIIMCGKPFITRDSPAIRELEEDGEFESDCNNASYINYSESQKRNYNTNSKYSMDEDSRVGLVPPENPQALVEAIESMEKNLKISPNKNPSEKNGVSPSSLQHKPSVPSDFPFVDRITPEAIGKRAKKIIGDTLRR